MYLSSHLPGIGGRLRSRPEDFVVVEVPAYEPRGEGPHAYFEVTKRELTTSAMVEELARRLDIPRRDIGYAGQKDRHAITTQRLSVPAVAEEAAAQALEGLVEWRSLGRHDNKLRKGHLQGNRFRITVREVHPQAAERAGDIATHLEKTGWPNFFGPQRFGREGDNAQAGRAILQEGARMPRWKRDLLVAAYQSELFNRYLVRRIEQGLLATALEGDVMAKLPAGAMFTCESPTAEQPRVEAFEITPTGPIFGFKMRSAEGPAAELEERILSEEGLDKSAFRKAGAQGSRRRLRLPLQDFSMEAEDQAVVFEFFLPSGSYATVLLGEFMKA